MTTTWIAGLVALLAALSALADEEDPPEYKDRTEARDAYRRGYERGFERGYQRGLDEGEKRNASRPPPPPPPVVLGPIRVTRAEYGNSSRTCNATRFVARAANGRRSHSFKVSAAAREHQDIYLNCHTP